MRVLDSKQIKVREGIYDGKHYTTCTHDCPDACNIELTVKDGKISDISGDANHAITRGWLCSKTPLEIIESLNNNDKRLKYPLKNLNGEWKRISWAEALNLICEKITEYKEQYGPLSILHYYGAGSFGGLKRTYTKRFFSLLGGTSTISGSICDSAGIEAQTMDFGDQRTHAPNDMLNSKSIIVWGKNPANANPHFTQFLKEAKNKSIKVSLIDPIKTKTANTCTEYYRVNPGTDKFLALSMAKIIIQEDLINKEFITNYTIGYDDYKNLALSVDINEAADLTGISKEDIYNLAISYANSKPASIWLGFGLQRYVDGGETFRIIDGLGVITGNIGKSGGGVSHQNSEVQKYFDYNVNLENSIRNKRFFRKAALAEDLKRITDPPIKMIMVTGVNPVAQCPNSLRVKEAIENTEFVVVIDAFLTDTAMCADLVLPTTRLLEEEDVMWAYSHHYIGLSKQILPAPGEAKSDFHIFQLLAERLGFLDEMGGTTKEWIDKILAPVSSCGINYEKLSQTQVLNPNLHPVAYNDLRFTTPSGKFNFIRSINFIQQLVSSEDFPYTFLTVHHHNWLNSNIYSEKQIQELGVPPFAFINPLLAKKINLLNGEKVIVYSHVGEMMAEINISDKYPSSTITMYQGGRVEDRTCPNIIIDDKLISDFGDMAAYYSARVNVRKINH